MVLDETLHSEIATLCEQGDSLAKEGHYREGLRIYHQAWELLPEPKEDWNAATWILSAIGDAHFVLKDYESSRSAFVNAVHCPSGLGNPFIHLRIGESCFELGDLERAKNELTRAYMGAGKEIFANEDPKYFALLESVLQPMPGDKSL